MSKMTLLGQRILVSIAVDGDILDSNAVPDGFTAPWHVQRRCTGQGSNTKQVD
eukprot:CAMPEP_0172784218 /NCGR_PEP_ID=MMETSP1074-20121228/204833_1 /TAXON_ID=2916 /ORGANISM="Ceratium fusus, Strain PA161109" /LENGTH=52 /DNA_ID=CAMNT_0013621221 /DNA_START=719 /DNA_END=877 /DNA_ORIENTATION=+